MSLNSPIANPDSLRTVERHETKDPIYQLPIVERERVQTGYEYLGEYFIGKPLTDGIKELLQLAEVAVVEDPGWGYSYYRKEIVIDYQI